MQNISAMPKHPYRVALKTLLFIIVASVMASFTPESIFAGTYYDFENTNTPQARIANIHEDRLLLVRYPSTYLREHLASFATGSEPDGGALEAGYGFISELTNHAGAVQTFFTLADETYGRIDPKLYELMVKRGGRDFMPKVSDALGNYCKWFGVASMVIDTISIGTGNKEFTEAAVYDYLKNGAYNVVGFLGKQALQLGFVGVYIFDYTLNKFNTAAMEAHKDQIRQVYHAYVTEKFPRQYWMKRLRDVQAKCLANEKTDKFGVILEGVLHEAAQEFWRMPPDERALTALRLDKWPNEVEQADLTEEMVIFLKKRLVQMGVFTELQKDVAAHMQKELVRNIRNVAALYNSQCELIVGETRRSDGKPYYYAGYKAVLGPVKENPKDWSATLNTKGAASINFTMLGHSQCGKPHTVYLYAPNADITKDKPVASKRFKLKIGRNIVVFSPPLTDFSGKYRLSGESIEYNKKYGEETRDHFVMNVTFIQNGSNATLEYMDDGEIIRQRGSFNSETGVFSYEEKDGNHKVVCQIAFSFDEKNEVMVKGSIKDVYKKNTSNGKTIGEQMTAHTIERMIPDYVDTTFTGKRTGLLQK